MIDLILLLIIGSLWIWGVFAAFDDPNIFWPVRKFIEKNNDPWITKPLFGCVYCMASVHGFYLSGVYCLAGHHPFWIIPIYIICLCGLNFIIKEYLYP